MNNTLRLLPIIFFLIYGTLFAQSKAGDENWDARFYPPGGGISKVFISPSGEFFVNTWKFLDSVQSYQFPKWTGTKWVAGVDRVAVNFNSQILAVDTSGLSAQGWFVKQNGDTIKGFAKWNGTDWIDPKIPATNFYNHSSDTSFSDATISGYYIAKGKFIVTGYFDSASDGNHFGGIARWDDDHWFSFGNGLDTISKYRIRAILTVLFDSSNIVAVCNLQKGNDPSIQGLVRWSEKDSTWSIINTFPQYSSESITALAKQGQGLYVGGSFTSIGNKGISNIAYWDGTDFYPVGTPKDVLIGSVTSIVPDGSMIHVLGNLQKAGKVPVHSIATWTGSEWSDKFERWDTVEYYYSSRLWKTLPTVNNFFIWNNKYYCVTEVRGEYSEICQWQDSLWVPIEKKNFLGLEGTVYSILAENDTNVFVGGQFQTFGDPPIKNLARWNGVEWKQVCTDHIEGSIDALYQSGDSLYIGGNFVVPGKNIKHIALITNNSIMPLGNWNDSSVSCIYKIQAILYAGYLQYNRKGVAYFRDSVWVPIEPEINNYYGSWDSPYALSQDFDGRLLAAGSQFCQIYDGISWSDAGPDTILGNSSSIINSIYRTNDNLFFGGRFLTRDFSTNPVVGILSRTGSIKYDSFFTMQYPDIFGLAGRSDNDIYAIGNIYQELDGRNNYIYGVSHFNGNTWESMGSGIDYNEISAIATIGNEVFVGGSFFQAGDKYSSSFGIWHIPPASNSVKEIIQVGESLSLAIYPNPASEIATVKITSTKLQPVKLVLYDELGRKIQDIFSGEIGENGKDFPIAASHLVNGVYLFSIQTESGNYQAKIIVRH